MQLENKPGGRSFIEQARRAQILAATAEVVAKDGFAKASLSRIAEHADISKGVVTYHFTNKAEILEQMVTEFFERSWEYMEPRITAEPTAIGQVNAWVTSQIEFLTSHPTEFFAMASIIMNHPDANNAFGVDNSEAIEGLSAILASGQDEGQLRDFDTDQFANIILSSIDGVVNSWAFNRDRDTAADIEALKDFISHAITTE